jgi:hypothetical protein
MNVPIFPLAKAMSYSQRDQKAEAVVKSAIVHLFGEEAIDHIEVRPVEDQAGEPGLSVTIFLKAAPREPMPGSLLLDTIAAAATALREIDDYRFPYVTFLAPEYEAAEDTRPTA